MFREEFESLLSSILLLPLPSMLGGDFNIHINSNDDTDATNFIALLAEYNYSIFDPCG